MDIKSIEQTPDGFVCILTGELDLVTTPDVKSEVTAALQQSTRSNVTLDLTQVSFMDSAGMAFLLYLYKSAEFVSQLHLVVASRSQPERVIKLACFERIMDVQAVPSRLPATKFASNIPWTSL